MIQKLVAAALRMPLVVFAIALVIVVGGLYCYAQLDIEAYPNPVPPMVEVITQPQGVSAEEVERYTTIPIEIGLSGMLGLDHIRSQSLFGLSDVKCYFKWSATYKDARQEVINRLQFVTLQPGVQATLSPTNAIGEVFRYKLVDTTAEHKYNLRDLKTAEDWVLERQFRQVPGVIDVTGYGGQTKQYHVEVDPYRLRGQGLTLQQLITAIANSNSNVGGQRLSIGEQSYTVRAVGIIKSLRDIGNVVIAETKDKAGAQVPIRVRDVAETVIGFTPRLGIVGKWGCMAPEKMPRYCSWDWFKDVRTCDEAHALNDGHQCIDQDDPDIVQGIILMRYGGETPHTLEGIYERINYIRKFHLLPPGMDIEPYYDRGHLVRVTTHTVLENLLVGMVLVTVVLFIFLGHTKAALITAINIPLALLIAFIGMVTTGTPANLISLGAVDFGIVIDSTVIMMENIFRHLGPHGHGSMRQRIESAAAEVGGPMSFSTLIIGVAFLPLFTMTGVSGVIFSPMAHTYAFAIGGAILLALTLTPTLSKRFMPPDLEEKESFVMHGLQRMYQPLFNFAGRAPKRAAALALMPVLVVICIFPFLGGEFMPKLEEGNFWIRATLPQSISLEQSSKYVGKMRAILRSHKEIVTVVSQLGRPDDGTDVSGFFNIELFAPLAPFDEWPRGQTKEKLTEELSAEFQKEFPGIVFGFSQMISDNVEEALSGVKGENSVKIIGPDLRINENKANAIVDVMGQVNGIKDLGLFSSLGQPSLKIVPDRLRCARYGLNTGDIEAVVQAAIGGQTVTTVYEGEKFFDLTVRWNEANRSSVSAIRQITVASPDGSQIPLGQIADITQEDGPSVIYREDGMRYAPVKFSVRGRDLKSTIAEAQQKINAQVKLPYDTHLEWGGEINELKESMGRLVLIIPLTLLLIVFLVYSAVKTWIDTAIVVLSIPVACAGGVLALGVTGVNFSISAAMGFISIFGIAIQDSLIVVTYYQRLRELDKLPIEEAAKLAAERRLRPVLMTTLVAML
ncbi:MAG TPA: efflux RND transporter permease subunit, partial [Polyangia bacterium]|nr:efflux RND transporter permease subunit [Polyangia bacterium]